MNGQNVGYIRVSTVGQNTERQLDEIPLDIKFVDHASGKDTHRPELEACLKHLRAGDILHIHSIDRLARNLLDLQKIVNGLTEKGVCVFFLKEGLTFSDKSDTFSTLMLQMLGAFAEFERSMIRERQREGIAIARKKGKQIGAKVKLSAEQQAELKQRLLNREPKTQLAAEFGISRQTLYNYIK